jgi:serine/threonine-protein kinase
MPLEQLGPYQLEKLLGRGGMGAVYVGLHRETGERAAVKVLSGHLADDEFFRERFKQEIETLKRLLHPNIVQLFGFGEDEGYLYYVMELVQGRNLQDELTSGRRFTWREVARIGIAVAQALKHAHDRGIIHRDLKPANLMLDTQEFVKLTDFGIAKLYGGTNVTAEGGVLGTADYMAPEQADGKQVTARSDLYALGSVMHALLAGKPPFAGRTVLEVMTSLKNEKPVPVRRLAPDTPAEFEKIILQLLEKDPQKRIPTALALSNRLKAMEFGLSMETRVVSPAPDKEEADQPAPGSARTSSEKTLASDFATGATAAFERRGDDFRLAAEAPTLIPDSKTDTKSRSAFGSEAGQSSEAGLGNGRASEWAGESALEPAAAAVPPKAGRFTTVTEQDLRGARETEDTSPRPWILGGGFAAIVLVFIAGGAYFATRTPSADGLHAIVRQAAEAGGPEELIAVEEELKRFFEAYPTDPRAAEMRGYQADLERYRLQQRFESRIRRGGGSDGLSAIERAYLEAVQLSATDEESALARFEALITVFDGPLDPAQSKLQQRANAQCLDLAREQARRLRASLAKITAQQRAEVRRQLERADKLAANDPVSAVGIWRGIVTLYRGKTWAAELVEEAEAKLAEQGEAADNHADATDKKSGA